VDAQSVQHCPKSPTDPRFTDAITKARRQVLVMMRDRRIPGMAVTVAVDGQTVWSEGFGYSDVEARTPVCPETRFRIASVSKPITATAMAKLYDEGKLDLDAPIQRYVPTFPEKGGVITARQLASHRAGIRHYRDDNEAFTRRHFTDVVESLALFDRDTLLFAPGTKHHYSSFGYVLLSAVIQGAAQQEFGQYLEQHVFKPLGLQRTSLDRTTRDSFNARVAGQTRFYDHVTPYVTDGQVHPSPFVDMSSKWAGGGMLSTTEDLARFGSAMLPGSRSALLRPETRSMVFTPLTRTTPPLFGYALGWITMRDVDLRRVHMHFGAGSGATAWLGILPDQRVVVAVLANLGHAGFTYASTVGLAGRFARTPFAPLLLVAIVSFVTFAVATWIVAKLVRLIARRVRGRRAPAESAPA
jgi:serine beta-lactamase-like protein LACTB